MSAFDLDVLYAAFSEAMEGLGPFGCPPVVAVAVSGGADSLALALLARRWALDRGGCLYALTVDHRLRSESATEACQVADWMRAHGIRHHILVPDSAPPPGAGQEWARRCRYTLLDQWCREQGIVHLLLGHHQRDQDETRILRRNAGSGSLGLAGMAPLMTRENVCLLRPLLHVDPDSLRAFLIHSGQLWIEDPSNKNLRYERIKIRQRLLAGDKQGHPGTCAAERFCFERRVDEVLAAAVWIDASGCAICDYQALRDVSPDEAMHALRRVLMCVGGLEYPPRQERLLRLMDKLPASATLGGCVLVPQESGLLIAREMRGLPDRIPVALWPSSQRWDGRFLIGHEGDVPEHLSLAPLGREGTAFLKALEGCITPLQGVPLISLATLPAFWLNGVLVSVPQVGYFSVKTGIDRAFSVFARFSPCHPLGSCGFRLASGPSGPM
ncbi:tRNA lysidine(34) synthetase TilS [Haematospirillum jordaniae]|nr:tRNA lysidine(34) synthetase TilS [Haematospirillum jordaniae]NKD44210.1 tRNA lysidine(34) synthetase TilS [Haematospirillum jordaniae]NKD56588.1 tRNA lysidine(34) synthetase TilS [Haematospirillum jordaniae]NKD58646.1 tRNA lysidine(34) synthetase TilS [Haematospirillum jordaniae]NKD66185.1 tRNA lysidine(34) synthetase TilS [Haematospirillum jordaniae]NKD78648.1 tRNA lysidine(34) synthetase TilS [Haematospirillum jordaniae]